MNVDFINPFIEASSNVINQTTGFQVSLGKLRLKSSPYKCSGVAIIVGITGKIKGQAVLSMGYGTSIRIVSAMMMGAEVTELDPVAKSALGELANMILGNTASVYYAKGWSIDITPPSILTGENLEISCSKQDIVCIPMIWGEAGQSIDLDISFLES